METETLEKREGEEEGTSTVANVNLVWLIQKSPDLATEILITLSTRSIRKLCSASKVIKDFCVEKLDKYFWLAMWESDTRMLNKIKIVRYDIGEEHARRDDPEENPDADLWAVVEILAKIIYANPGWAPDWIIPSLDFTTMETEKEWADRPGSLLADFGSDPIPVPVMGDEAFYELRAWLKNSTVVQAFARFDALLAEPRFVSPILAGLGTNRLVLLVDRKGDFWEKGNTGDLNSSSYLMEPILELAIKRFKRAAFGMFSDPGPPKKIHRRIEPEERGKGGKEEEEEEEEDITTLYLVNGAYRWTRAIPEHIPLPPWERDPEVMGPGGILLSSWLGGDIRVKHGEPGDEPGDEPRDPFVKDPDRLGIASDVFYFMGSPQKDIGPGPLFRKIPKPESLREMTWVIEEGDKVPKELFENGTLPTPGEVDAATVDKLKRYRLMMIVPGEVKYGVGTILRSLKRDSKVLYDTTNVGSRLVSGKKLAERDLAYFYHSEITGFSDRGNPIFVSYKKIMKSEKGNVFVYFYVFLHYEMTEMGRYRLLSVKAEPFRLKFSNRDFVDRMYTADFESKYVINPKDRINTWNEFRGLSEKSSATGRVPSLSDITRDVRRLRGRKRT